jgi:hypothetical protein
VAFKGQGTTDETEISTNQKRILRFHGKRINNYPAARNTSEIGGLSRLGENRRNRNFDKSEKNFEIPRQTYQ